MVKYGIEALFNQTRSTSYPQLSTIAIANSAISSWNKTVSEAKLSKVKSPSKKNKVPLKGELILELKDFSFLSEIWKLKIQC